VSQRSLVGFFSSLVLCISVLGGVASGQAAEADISVEQSVHKGDHLGPVGPAVEGDLLIGRKYSVAYNITNGGDEAARVTFRWHLDPPEGDPDYDTWTIPLDKTGVMWQDTSPGDDCDLDHPVCTVTIRAGRSYHIRLFTEANAPGAISIFGSATSEADDPNPGNNRSETFRARVECSITGTDGKDTLEGTESRDSICGGEGDDLIRPSGNGDKVFGGPGDDVIIDDGGNQTHIGGAGSDRASYAESPNPIMVWLNSNHMTGWGFDTLVSIEDVVGSSDDDYIEGNVRANSFKGGGGSDRLNGRGGKDLLSGGRNADDFVTKDHARDVVRGNRGPDRGLTDLKDKRRSVQRVHSTPFRDTDPR
jgi:Ca2+-binding RTX toxin-like protein